MATKRPFKIICARAGKKWLYPSFESAKRALENIRLDYNSRGKKYKESRIYYCNACGGYHITTSFERCIDRISPTSKMKKIRPRKNRALIIGGIYRHFKGDYYHVLATARNTATNESMVLYRLLYRKHSHFRVRPFKDFMAEVDHETYPRVRQKYRFELIECRDFRSGKDLRYYLGLDK